MSDTEGNFSISLIISLDSQKYKSKKKKFLNVSNSIKK